MASTSNIVASGAIACAHSTSREISSAQSSFELMWVDILCSVKFAAGKLKLMSKFAKSVAIVGSSKASTTAIVLPAPFVVDARP